jgi:S-adenosylmethionine:tRNA ribosyltransferase-isomerase
MNRTKFNFDFPEHLVAQVPLPERDCARLLCWDHPFNQKQDRNFSELPVMLRERFPRSKFDSVLLIVNDSRVYPARMRVTRKSGGSAEVFVLSAQSEEHIPCLLRPQKKLRVGEVLHCEGDGSPVFEITSINPPQVKNISGLVLSELLAARGEMPLPPYIERTPSKLADPSLGAIDKMRYQTVYAKESGSCAAPTAGLHFTPKVIESCSELGISIATVTLHVGLGTFQPVTAEFIHEHKMHEEFFQIPTSTTEQILSHLDHGWPIVFVGTTSLRCVESAFLLAQQIDISRAGSSVRDSAKSVWGVKRDAVSSALRAISDHWHKTDLFIQPADENFRYSTQCGDAIVTNFHQPESTLTMLIASLLGYGSWRELYDHAIQSEYRLFSYGDSSLLIFPDALK